MEHLTCRACPVRGRRASMRTITLGRRDAACLIRNRHIASLATHAAERAWAMDAPAWTIHAVVSTQSRPSATYAMAMARSSSPNSLTAIAKTRYRLVEGLKCPRAQSRRLNCSSLFQTRKRRGCILRQDYGPKARAAPCAALASASRPGATAFIAAISARKTSRFGRAPSLSAPTSRCISGFTRCTCL